MKNLTIIAAIVGCVAFAVVLQALPTVSGTYEYYSDESTNNLVGEHHIDCAYGDNYRWGITTDYWIWYFEGSCGQGSSGCVSGTWVYGTVNGLGPACLSQGVCNWAPNCQSWGDPPF